LVDGDDVECVMDNYVPKKRQVVRGDVRADKTRGGA
jgi:hypothetical protein